MDSDALARLQKRSARLQPTSIWIVRHDDGRVLATRRMCREGRMRVGNHADSAASAARCAISTSRWVVVAVVLVVVVVVVVLNVMAATIAIATAKVHQVS